MVTMRERYNLLALAVTVDICNTCSLALANVFVAAQNRHDAEC